LSFTAEPFGEPMEQKAQRIPVLKSAILCDAVAVDPNNGKKTLVGVFSHVGCDRYPTAWWVSLFAAFADVHAPLTIAVRFVRAGQDTPLVAAEIQVAGSGRLGFFECVLPPVHLPLPEPGLYEVQFWVAGQHLGGVDLTASAKPQAEGHP
jgi:hypothetical protein